MRILSTVFFLSFLAGKFATFEQMLLTEPINFFGKTKRMRLLSVRIWRYIKNFELLLPRKVCRKITFLFQTRPEFLRKLQKKT